MSFGAFCPLVGVNCISHITLSILQPQTVLKFVLFAAGDLADVFLFVTVGTGIYWLIFYKVSSILSGLSFIEMIVFKIQCFSMVVSVSSFFPL